MNGAKLMAIWDVFCPQGLEDFVQAWYVFNVVSGPKGHESIAQGSAQGSAQGLTLGST
jgi:hypothetical protein